MNFMDYGPDLEQPFRTEMARQELNRGQHALLDKIAKTLGRPYTEAGWPGPHPIQVRLSTYMIVAGGRATQHFPLVIELCKRTGLQAKVMEQGGLLIWR